MAMPGQNVLRVYIRQVNFTVGGAVELTHSALIT
jgi:hypothetical protein